MAYWMVITTVDCEHKAHEIARRMVEDKVVACAQVSGPIKSYYWWKGKMESEAEWRVVMKTSRDREAVEERLRKVHPYEVPQMVFLEMSVTSDYGKWLEEVLK